LNNNTATTFLRGKGGVSYNWTPSILLSHPESKNTYATINTNISFVLAVEDSFGCKDKDTVDVNLYPKTIIKNNPKDTSVCMGDSIQLLASGALTYQWIPASLVNKPTIHNPLVYNIISPLLLYVKGIDSNGCEGFDTLKIKTYPPLNLSLNPKNAFACLGDSLVFSASGAKSYNWFPSEGLNNDSISNPTLYVTGPKTYYIKAITVEGCREIDSLRVNVHPSPVVDAFSFDNQNIVRCKGSEITLNATGANRYSWSPAEYCSNPNGSSTMVFPIENTVFRVIGINDNGCSAIDSVSVIYEGAEKVVVPDVFSPNNDQINDRIGVIDECNVQFLSMDIFNRWGQNVFSGYNLSDKWDGNVNGKPCEIGVYYYIIKAKKLNGEAINFKGDITLIR
jgi:gliding motility-associated-like protein